MRRKFRLGFTAIGLSIACFGQAPSPAPANKAQPQSEMPAILKQYDYSVQIGALNDLESLDPSLKSDLVSPRFASTGEGASKNDVAIPTRSTPQNALSPTALAAVRVSEKWRGEINQPAAGPDGRVLYSFGAGLP